MTFKTGIEFMDFSRQKTLGLVDTLAKLENVQQVLGWRPGPGRAHLAWQLMHIAATDDRHVHVRMTGGQLQNPEYVRRFAGGSTPDDDIPKLAEIRRYLDEQRKEVLAHLSKLPESALTTKPNEQAPWTYQEWMKVLAWHEAHHQG
ncbi:MAG: DinB family protein, partial [Gemmataceae bacterium]|nr:DinB family protein [Gemmataceae bacterium]